jgi:hypothetical protein
MVTGGLSDRGEVCSAHAPLGFARFAVTGLYKCLTHLQRTSTPPPLLPAPLLSLTHIRRPYYSSHSPNSLAITSTVPRALYIPNIPPSIFTASSGTLAQRATTCLLSTSRIGLQRPRMLPIPLHPSPPPLNVHDGPSTTSTVPHSPQPPHHRDVPATFVPERITRTSRR